jgi:hypothetical protein
MFEPRLFTLYDLPRPLESKTYLGYKRSYSLADIHIYTTIYAHNVKLACGARTSRVFIKYTKESDKL